MCIRDSLSDALPQTAQQQLEDWYAQEPFEQNRWDWGEVWQQLNRSIQDLSLIHISKDDRYRQKRYRRMKRHYTCLIGNEVTVCAAGKN